MNTPYHVLALVLALINSARRVLSCGWLTALALAITGPIATAVQPYSYSQSFYSSPGVIQPPAEAIPLPDGMIWVVEYVSGYVVSSAGSLPALARAYSRATPASAIEEVVIPTLKHVGDNESGHRLFSIGEPVTAYFSGTFSVDAISPQSLGSGSGLLSLVGYLTPTLGGDFNGDSVVDAADYTVYRDQSLYWGPGDYQQWAAAYGSSATSASGSASAPEPSTVVIGLMGLVSLLSRRVR